MTEKTNLIPQSMQSSIPSMVKNELSKMDAQKQSEFLEEFKRKGKSKGTAYLLLFLFGWHYTYLGKWQMQILFILTGGGLLIWAIIDLFRLSRMVEDYNKDIATNIFRDMKIIS